MAHDIYTRYDRAEGKIKYGNKMYCKINTFLQVFEVERYTFDVDAVLQYRINEIVIHEMNDISEEIYSKREIEIFAQRLPRCISN